MKPGYQGVTSPPPRRKDDVRASAQAIGPRRLTGETCMVISEGGSDTEPSEEVVARLGRGPPHSG